MAHKGRWSLANKILLYSIPSAFREIRLFLWVSGSISLAVNDVIAVLLIAELSPVQMIFHHYPVGPRCPSLSWTHPGVEVYLLYSIQVFDGKLRVSELFAVVQNPWRLAFLGHGHTEFIL